MKSFIFVNEKCDHGKTPYHCIFVHFTCHVFDMTGSY